MKIAVAQISCALGDRDANLRKVREYCERARSSGAELVVFPEMTDIGYSMPVIRQHAAKWCEGAAPLLQKISRELSLAIVCGISDRDGDKIYNAQVFIDKAGQIAAKYRKTHLVTAPLVDERPVFTPGNAFAHCALDRFNFGLSICYDLRFPELCRTLAVKHGVNAFVISSAWPVLRQEHLRIFARARAIENQSYLLLSNRVGTDDGVTLCGSSAIIDPSGAVLAAGSSDRQELLEAEIFPENVDLVRAQMKVFDHRRGDLY